MSLQDFLNGFNNPPAEYGLQPFWFWNGDLDPAELLRQIGLMHEQGVTGFIIHARLGLTIPYLSEAWFDRVRVALEEARKLGMVVWIYDEENWASGYAGGRVLARDASLTPQCLSCERIWLDANAPLPEILLADDPRGRGEIVAINACQVWSEPHAKSPFEWNGPHRRHEAKWHDQTRFKLSFGEVITLWKADSQRASPPPIPFEISNLRSQIASIRASGSSSNLAIQQSSNLLVTVHRRQTTEWYPAYTDEYYVDVLRKETALLFIEETHEQYWSRFSEFFGSTIKGFFVDEPGLYNNFWDRNPGSIAWTEDFAEAFIAAKGYDIRDCLLALYEPVAIPTPPTPSAQRSTLNASSVRFDYYDFVGRLMQERFMQPLADWCESKGVEHTGHLMLEEFMVGMARYAGNPFRQLSTLHTPGVDRIDEVYEKVSERIASSVAHLTGRRRVISESYALIGWKLAPPYMKEIFDYQAARGVNLLCPHAFYYSIEGFRKDECPPSEFFQNPWWPHFKPFADYVRRTCYALSQGKPAKDFLLYYPIDTVYTLISPEWPRAASAGPTEHWQLSDSWHPAVHVDQEFVKLVVHLEEAGFDFDLIDYTFLEIAQVTAGDELTTASSVIPPPLASDDRALGGGGGKAAGRGGGGMRAERANQQSTINNPFLCIGDLSVPTIVVPYASYMPELALEKLREFAQAGGNVILYRSSELEIEGAEDLPPAPLQLIHHLHPLKQGRTFTTLEGSDEWPRMNARRTPSVANPQREIRRIPGLGPTVHTRRLDSGELVVFLAKPMALCDEGWNLLSYLSHRTLALDAATGDVDGELSTTGDANGRELHAARDSMLLVITEDPLTIVDHKQPSDSWFSAGASVELKEWSVEWPDGSRQDLDGPCIWSDLGRPYEAGPAIYRCTLHLKELPSELWIHTYLYETAEARLNESSLGARCFPSFGRFAWDATAPCRLGDNQLEVIVAGTLTGKLEGKERLAGIQYLEARAWPKTTKA